MRVGRSLTLCAAALCLVAAVAPPVRAGSLPPRTELGPMDWPTYGHDFHRTFAGRTSLDPQSVTTLSRAWFFPTGDAVTAEPIVAGGTVYAGSWDGHFYAIDVATGAQRWSFTLKAQPAVSPQPGNRQPGDATTDGGMVTSTASFLPGRGNRPDLVIFGGGYTLYALRAGDGTLYWEHDYTGRPENPPNPTGDDTRIFSSPAVVGDQVLFGVSADGSRGFRGYFVAADLASGNPRWIRELDVDPGGHLLNDGCGSVWSSPTIIEKLGLAVFDVSDCHFTMQGVYTEHVLAVRIGDGAIAWSYAPSRPDNGCDFDFGATANLGIAAGGTPSFLGVGGKDGTYYSLDPATGAARWQTNVVFGGFAGGFIGSTAYDGTRAYGATALGDFGRFEGVGTAGCDPGNPRDLPLQEPSMHAFDAAGGGIAWEQPASQSFGSTAVAGGMVFAAASLLRQMQVRDAATGTLLMSIPLPANSDSGAVVAGDAVIFGTGSSEQGTPDGIYAYTPHGAPPQIPAASGDTGPPALPAAAGTAGLATLPSTGSPPSPGWPGGVAVAVLAAAVVGRRPRPQGAAQFRGPSRRLRRKGGPPG
jgi:outer membrane protein assembly factor BamB